MFGLPSIVTSGLIGGLISVITFSVIYLLFSKKMSAKKRKIVSITTSIIIILVVNILFIDPVNNKKKEIKSFVEMARKSPVFSILMKHDPSFIGVMRMEMEKSYEKIMNSKNPKEMAFLMGARIVKAGLKKYVIVAGFDVMLENLRNIIRFGDYLRKQDVNIFCQHFYPAVFGRLYGIERFEKFIKDMNRNTENIVISAKKNPGQKMDIKKAQADFQKFGATYRKKFPKKIKIFSNIHKGMTKEQKQKLAEVMIHYHREILKLDKKTAADIARLRFL